MSGSLYQRIVRHCSLPGAAVILVLFSACSGHVADSGLQPLTITLNSGDRIHYRIELADDDNSRRRGLMYRRELPAEQGMLLDFGHDRGASIWMKNTYIPLDLIFINGEGSVVKLVSNAEPLVTRPVYREPTARAVLEVNGGQIAEHGIAVGDTVQFNSIFSHAAVE